MRKFDNRMTTTAGLRLMLAASASAAAFALAGVAYAQEDDVKRVPDAAEDESDREERDTVVVTGSRIRRDEFSSAAPVQVIDPRLGEMQGLIDTGALIQSSSVAAGSAQVNAAISSNFVTNGGQGASTISLRGLGAERTLVLLNGRRAGPAGTRGAVNNFDLNVLPQSVIGTVEILKDGASSIYGSDAVAGVVNIITARDTEGFEVDGFISQPLRDGGEEYRGALTYGKIFDRGHVMASFDYYRRQEVARGDRSYLNCSEERIFDRDGNRKDVVDPRTGKPVCRDLLWGHIWLYDYQYYTSPNPSNLVASNGRTIRRLQYDYPGSNLAGLIPPLTAPADPEQFSAPAGFFPVGYDTASFAVENADHPFNDFDTVVPKTERFTFYLDGSYELTGGVEAYGEVLLNRRKTYQNGSRQFWQFGFTESSLVPWLFGFLDDPDGVVAVPPTLSGDPNAPGITGAALISPTAYTDHSDTSQTVDYMRFVGGLRGEFAGGFMSGWSWDVYGQHSRNDGDYRSDQILQDSIDSQDFRLDAFFDPGVGAVVRDPSFASCSGSVTPVGGRNCLDINWNDPQFLAGNLTPEQRAFLFDTEKGETKYRQTYIEGILTGNLFTLPAGSVGIALGGTWRHDEINDTPGEITLANNAWGNTGAGITKGSSNTKEFFGEIDIPVLRNAPFAQSFDIQAAGRYTDVSTFGSDTTYKVGANWQVNDWVRFRGTYGTSFRAPALFELFLADQTSFIDQRNIDPCIQWANNLANNVISQQIADNCAADGIPANFNGGAVSSTVITGGGLGVLDAETSKAKTASVILTPDIFGERTNVQLAVDYFDIKVAGEVSQLGAASIVFGCYSSDFFPNDPLCSLFQRGQPAAPFGIDFVRDSFINVNSQKNRGIDTTLRVDHELWGNMGNLALLAQFTVQFKDTVALFEGTETSVNGEDGEPKWVGDINMTWDKDDWTVFYGLDLVGPTSDEGDFIRANGDLCLTDVIRGEYCVDAKAEQTIYHNVSVTKKFSESVQVTAGVSNLFDEHPPAVTTITGEISTIGTSVFASNYDLVGRRIFANIKASF